MDIRKAALFTLFVILFSFFYVTLNADITGHATRVDPVVRVDSAACQWKSDHFEVCSAISWDAEQTYYAQAYIGGGDPLSKAPKLVNNPSLYCQDVGTLEGKRAVNAYLYSSQGSLKSLSVDTVVVCSRDQVLTKSDEVKKFIVEARNEFTQRPAGSGEVVLTGFAGKPAVCRFSGRFLTDAKKESGTGICHKASGTFEGLYDHGLQQVVVDPLPFTWQGFEGLFSDPGLSTYDGFVGYMTLCDRGDYKAGRYYARFAVTEVTDDSLTLGWEYFDENLVKVNFYGEVSCDVESEEVSVITPEVIVPVEESPVVEEVEEESMPPVEEPMVGTPIEPSFWSRVWLSVRGWFS
ncbi:MAG: hypothetical protein Q7R56_00265 [Nanoarchaeota archaeon]|nr:hypothetical protein [Nanoarchaeota archaeon]